MSNNLNFEHTDAILEKERVFAPPGDLVSTAAFVILKQGIEPSENLAETLRQQVRATVGALAVPDELEFVQNLPKTRSGKIMRRLLRPKEIGEPVGDLSTLDG